MMAHQFKFHAVPGLAVRSSALGVGIAVGVGVEMVVGWELQ